MRKYKGLLLSVSMAMVMMTSAAVVSAQETETAEAVTEAVSEAGSEAVAVDTAASAEIGEDGLTASDREALETYAKSSIEMVTGMSDEEAMGILNPTSILSNYQESVVASVQSWVDTKPELGDYLGVLGNDIELNKNTIVIKSVCDFTNTESVVTTTLNRKDLSMESMTFSTGDQSLGEKMEEAVLNTLMGVCIVFCMLLFLSFLISQFKHISKLEDALKGKKAPAAPAPAPKAPAAPVAAAVEEEVVDDGELIAVIAAAIAAAEGTTTDGFVVRSIKKSNRNKWQRA